MQKQKKRKYVVLNFGNVSFFSTLAYKIKISYDGTRPKKKKKQNMGRLNADINEMLR